MAQLSSVIGSILRDIISAQHEANLYSISLSETYGKDGKAKDFQLPNIVLSDMDLELKYAVISASENQEQHNIAYVRFRRFLNMLCSEVAKTVITSAVSTILMSDIKREEEDKRFFYHLKQEEELNRRFHSFLTRNMRNAFINNLFESVDNSTGKVKEDVLCRKLMEVVRSKFFNDSDLYPLFSGAEGKDLKQELDENVLKAVEGLVQNQSADANFRRVKTFPQLDVAVTADELGKLPEESIHSFKLKFSPNLVNITETELDEDLDSFVMN